MSESRGSMPWPPRPVFRSGGHAATPRPAEGVVTWNINTTCNYRCSYCTQRFLDDRKRWVRDGPAFLRDFAQLEGYWEIKISGGEPFLHPHLLEIVSGLRDLGHAVSVVTNFSAGEEALRAFLAAAGSALRVFSASLHLEYDGEPAELEAFLSKAAWLPRQLPSGASFNATCVATPGHLPRLEQIAELFARRGLRFKIQPEKQNREVIEYTEEQKASSCGWGGITGWAKYRHPFRDDPAGPARAPSRSTTRATLGGVTRRGASARSFWETFSTTASAWRKARRRACMLTATARFPSNEA